MLVGNQLWDCRMVGRHARTPLSNQLASPSSHARMRANKTHRATPNPAAHLRDTRILSRRPAALACAAYALMASAASAVLAGDAIASARQST
jgi:hypothetical protein